MTDGADVTSTWVLGVDARALDLAALFADGDALLEVDLGDLDPVSALRPGHGVHLWVADPEGGAVPPGLYATGSVVGADGSGIVSFGFDALATPVDGLVLLAGDAFVGSPLHAEAIGAPIPLGAAQAAAIADHPLDPGDLAPVLAQPLPPLPDVGADDDGVDDDDDDGIVLPALEVRLPADTLLVVRALDHDGWTVVHGDADMVEVTELPDQHRSFLDAVEYVAAVADPAGRSLPVVDLADGVEAVAIHDAEGGVYVVVKTAPNRFGFCWVDDDGTVEEIDSYASLKEAILLPVLDTELFGDD